MSIPFLPGHLGLVANDTAATAGHTERAAASNEQLVGYCPPRVTTGHSEAMQIEETRQEALDSSAMATLGASPSSPAYVGWAGWAGSLPVFFACH